MQKREYRRNLPHYHPGDAPYFITWRLKDSIPNALLQKFRREREVRLAGANVADEEMRSKIQKRYFVDCDNYLDSAIAGPRYLAQPRVADIVAATLLEMHEKEIYLVAYSIMPNHVHVVFEVFEDSPPLEKVMQLIKGRSARGCNVVLRRSGEFWQDESFDHVIRDGALGRVVFYVINNPVKAKLVADWEAHPHTYLDPGFLGFRKSEKFFE